MRWLFLACLLAVPTSVQAQNVRQKPGEAFALALADAKALKAGGQDPSYYRWISLYNEDEKEYKLRWEEISLLTNALNTKHRQVYLPVQLDGGRLLRVDFHSLGISAGSLDRLGSKGSGCAPFPEPYFHQEISGKYARKQRRTTTFRGQHWTMVNGEWELTFREGVRVVGEYDEAGTAGKNVLAAAVHIPPGAALEMFTLTGSEFSAFRADWFRENAGVAPAYYDLAGIPDNLEDIQKLAGFNEKEAAKQEGVKLRGAVLFSEVANRNRALEWAATRFNYGRGAYMQSLDFLASLREKDVVVNLDQGKSDAREIIWTTPNGLQAYAVVDGNGKRLDVAAADIAQDRRTARHEKQVLVGFDRCFHCHGNGFIAIDDEIRGAAKNPLALAITDPKLARKVSDQYFGADFNELGKGTATWFNDAVKSATGGKSGLAMSLQFAKESVRYQDAPIGLEDLGRETGWPQKDVEAAIIAAVGLDHSFTRLVAKRKARRDQLELAMQFIWTELMRRKP